MNLIVEKLNEELDVLLDESSPASAMRALHFSVRAISHGRGRPIENVPWVSDASGEPTVAERALAFTIVHAAEEAVGRDVRSWDDSIVAEVAWTLTNRAVRISTDHWGVGRPERANRFLRCSRLDPISIDPRQELAIWGGVDSVDVSRLFLKLDAMDLALIKLRVAGVSWDECGRQLSVPEATARQKWSRLLRRLQQILTDSKDGA